jgi:hypothetical protein
MTGRTKHLQQKAQQVPITNTSSTSSDDDHQHYDGDKTKRRKSCSSAKILNEYHVIQQEPMEPSVNRIFGASKTSFR